VVLPSGPVTMAVTWYEVDGNSPDCDCHSWLPVATDPLTDGPVAGVTATDLRIPSGVATETIVLRGKLVEPGAGRIRMAEAGTLGGGTAVVGAVAAGVVGGDEL
jgi:hypothetical protein